MAQVTQAVAQGILDGQGYTDNEVRQLAYHWLAAHSAPAAVAGPSEKWRERWYGSGGAPGYEGWSIVNDRTNALVAYLGRGVSSEAVREIVWAHNAAAPTTQAAQPAYPELPDFDAVEQHIYAGCRRFIDRDMLEPIHSLIREAVDADRASRGQAPVRAAQKYDDTLVPFLALMRRELHANSRKGDRPGWLSMRPDQCLLEIYWHAAKLSAAVKNGDQALIAEHAADVANMAMMQADIAGLLSLPTAQPAPVAQGDAASAGFFLQLPQRPKPEAPAGTVGLDWDAYSGAQMLAYGRDCSDAARAKAKEGGAA